MYLCRLMKKHILYILCLLICLWMTQSVSAQHHRKTSKAQKNKSVVVGCPLIDSIIDFSITKLGSAYRSGGTGPSGFDCSGFMYYTFGHFGIQLGRSSRDQFLMGKKVEKEDIRRGDLVFWWRGKGYIGHVGMVTDVDSAHNFTFIHSATHGKGVRYDKSTGNWYASTYAGARRIIDCDCEGKAFLVNAEKNTPIANNTTPSVEKDTTKKVVENTPIVEKETVVTPPQTATPKQKTIYHKIKQGETLSSIARKYHVSVQQLKKWNHLKSDMIRANAKLKIYK